MVRMSEALNESGNNIKKILIGSGVSILITIIGLVVYALVLTYTGIAESTIPTVVIVITLISILTGSSICTSSFKKNGFLNGALVGLIYICIIYLLSSIIEKDFTLNTYSIIMVIGGILAGGFGGIIGVNRK